MLPISGIFGGLSSFQNEKPMFIILSSLYFLLGHHPENNIHKVGAYYTDSVPAPVAAKTFPGPI